MKRYRILLFVACSLFIAAGMPGLSRAQETGIELTTWNVEVWPEYDKPAVLVIANGTIAEGTALPVTLRVPVPSGVTINAVADVDASGNLLTAEWRTEDTPSGQDVIFDLDAPGFVVEYYVDGISAPPNRSFDLSLVVPYAAQQGTLTLRQPERASDMQINPALAQTGTDSLGNPLYSQQLGLLTAGQEIPLSVSYTKPDAEPSVSATQPAASSQQPLTPASTASSTANWLPWVVAGLVLVLVGALVVYLVMQWQQRKAARSRQARRREDRERGVSPAPKTPPSVVDSRYQNAFCPQCGHKFEQSDKFCRGCGKPRT